MFGAIRFATGGGHSSSAQNAALTARLLQDGWGRAALLVLAVIAAAIGFAAYGADCFILARFARI